MNKRNKGFTLIELLVVISIIALLVSILLPALAAARRTAVVARCTANLQSMGTAYNAYCFDQPHEKVPHTYWHYDAVWQDPWGGNTVYHPTPRLDIPNYFGSKLIYNAGYFDNHSICYCPGMPRQDQPMFKEFTYEYYTDPDTGEWIENHNSWFTGISVNYNYWTYEFKKLSKLYNYGIMVDMIYDWDHIPHKAGNQEPTGLNVLYGDGHVGWARNALMFEHYLWFERSGWEGDYPYPAHQLHNFLIIMAIAEGLPEDFHFNTQQKLDFYRRDPGNNPGWFY